MMLTTDLYTKLLDAMSDAPDAATALRQVDAFRRLFAGPGTFSIQLNVTTRNDPKNEILLQRYYSSHASNFPVKGRKHKTLTPWTKTLFVDGDIFVAEGEEALSQTFDDYPEMRALGLNTVINVPLLKDRLCYATFNVFGKRGRWQADEISAMRLLALTATRWVTPIADLSYVFDTALPASLTTA
jgi:hypothetical protein